MLNEYDLKALDEMSIYELRDSAVGVDADAEAPALAVVGFDSVGGDHGGGGG